MVSIEKAEIVPVRVSPKTLWRHLRLTASDGSVGLGEFTDNSADESLDARVRQVAEGYLGKPLEAPDGAALAQASGGSFRDWTVASALAQALEDLCAKNESVALVQHLGGHAERRSVPVYANINRRTQPRTPEGFSHSAVDAIDAGFTAVKLAPFDDVRPGICALPEGSRLIDTGLDRVRAVRAAIAGRADLYVDCHWRFSAERAMALVPELADLGVVWFECPIPESRDSIPALRALRSRCSEFGMRLAGCETMNGTAGFEAYLRGEAYDVIMPDVKYCGGPGELVRIAEMAASAGIACSIHNPSGPVAHLFSVHVAAAVGTGERLEFQFDETPRFHKIVDPAPAFDAGCARVPDGPGLGARLLESGAG